MSIVINVLCHKLDLLMIFKVFQQKLHVIYVRKRVLPSITKEKRNVFGMRVI